MVPQYSQLDETPLEGYEQWRTEWNVRNLYATIMFALMGDMQSGALRTGKWQGRSVSAPACILFLLKCGYIGNSWIVFE